jgi:predicted flap endonuclease-1-like 5' DNA nuclease
MKGEESRLTEEDISKLAEAEDVAESDLKQLTGVDDELEKKLKGQGYATLWEVTFKDYDVFAVTAGVTKDAAEKIVNTANELLGL